MEELQFVEDAAAGRFRLLAGGVEVGFVDVDPVGDKSLLIKHTEVLPAHEGKGYGAELVRRTLEHARTHHRTVIPICPYALSYVRKHREYQDLVHADLRATL